MRQALEKTLRSVLERTVIKARDIAEQAVREAIERLGTGEVAAPGYLTEAETKLRVQLRAHGRHLGDAKLANGEQEIDLLISEAAYEHWHRMLFARFLEQNSLLMYDAGTHVNLEECGELAADEGFANGWAYASHLASKMLPQVFRQDSAVLQIELTLEHVRKLEQLIEALDPETFQAQDSLGWVYQFWQTKRKEQVNKSEVKIGAKELSPVTQLFTEPYMVSFLLDNALGAWWANRTLTPNDIETAKTEQDLRDRASIPGVPLTYLRFVQNTNETGESESTIQNWQPAAGKFEQWPQHLSELKTLDPCCGSGHFLVAAFSMLVPMRMADEGLSAKDAVNLVLSQNIHGLELDQRCVELAAFALALEAWRYPGAGGYRNLPELHLACSGLSVKAAKAEWKELGVKLADESGKKNISIALDWLHETFEDAPVLGSLINPRTSDAAKIVQWDELSDALNSALAASAEDSDEQHEAGIVAQGLAKAATLLAGQYSWVITNVPYLGIGDQCKILAEFCEENYPLSKNDLATVFLERCLELCVEGGASSIVLPQNWLFLGTYKKFRKKLLVNEKWNLIARLGAKSFTTPMWDFNVQLITISKDDVSRQISLNKSNQIIRGVDVSKFTTAFDKSNHIIVEEVKNVLQSDQLDNPDCKVSHNYETTNLPSFKLYSDVAAGLSTGDIPSFNRSFWELENRFGMWEFLHGSDSSIEHYSGRTEVIFWEKGRGRLASLVEYVKDRNHIAQNWLRGKPFWGQNGISVSKMANLPNNIYTGERFNANNYVIVPSKEENIKAIFSFVQTGELANEIRKFNSKVSIEPSDILNVDFDLGHWQKVAEEQYPNGLPQPYTNDPTQWIFHGHPCGSVIWHEQDKKTAMGELRKDETVLQTALARLLGYQWPAESDADMELAEEQRQWVNASESLNALIDDDGIACIPAIRGEKPAADRLEAMLQASYGDAWNINVLNELLASVKASSLEAWLRDKFFDQHSKMFGHRPFIWQVWDGLKDGFSALVNYHQLDADNLDRLIYTYLGDWIRSQEQGVKDGVDGADIRLAAAQNLKTELEAIKQGEAAADGKAGYDIFVRWKPTHEQPMGWNPDLNDGVRLNIRPFMTAKDMGKKGAGILRGKPNVHWKKDRGTDVESAPWYNLGEQYGEKLGSRINDHHLTLAEKQAARDTFKEQQDYIAKAGGVSESENPQGSLV